MHTHAHLGKTSLALQAPHHMLCPVPPVRQCRTRGQRAVLPPPAAAPSGSPCIMFMFQLPPKGIHCWLKLSQQATLAASLRQHIEEGNTWELTFCLTPPRYTTCCNTCQQNTRNQKRKYPSKFLSSSGPFHSTSRRSALTLAARTW